MKTPWLIFLYLGMGSILAQAQVLDLGLRQKPLGPYTTLTTWTLDRPKLGLALSGGGARGLAQIGVLQELERNAIPVDCIAGTSMGAIIGGLYALGYSAVEIESVAVAFRWDELIRDTPPRQQLFLSRKTASERHLLELHFNHLHLVVPSAFSFGQQLTQLLTRLVYTAPCPPVQDFDALPIPFRAVATDLISGDKVVLSSGSLVDAMRASMAIPLLFTPMTYNGKKLVDGGLVDNLPVDEALHLGADRVIAVDTSSPLHGEQALETPWIVADQTTTIMMRNQVEMARSLADTVIIPDLKGLTNTDFDHADAIIEAGRVVGKTLVKTLDRWPLDAKPAGQDFLVGKGLFITGLDLRERAEAYRRLAVDTSQTLSGKTLSLALHRLAQSGHYGRIEASLDSSGCTPKIEVSEPSAAQLPFWRVLMKTHVPLTGIQLMGNQAFEDSTLIKALDLSVPCPMNTRKLKSGVESMLRLYRDQGYALARIDTLFVQDGLLTLNIDEGRLERIDLMGVRHTKPFVIFREIPFRTGEVLTAQSLDQAMSQIYSTGYFDEVRVETNPGRQDHHLLFSLREKNHGIFRLGMRYDTDRKLAGFMEIAKDNFLGFGVQSALTGLAGHQDLDLSLRLSSDRLLYSFQTFSFELRSGIHKDGYFRDLKEIGRYETAIQWARLSTGQQMGRLGTVSGRITAENVEIRTLSGTTGPSESLRILSFGLRSEVDSRDHQSFPRKGMHHILDYESTGKLLGSTTSYARLESMAESYHSTSRYWTLHPRLHWGTSDLTTPYHKQFKLGGPLSFPALPQNALRGRRFVALSAELIFHLPRLFFRFEPHLSLRGDIAGAWDHYHAIKADAFHRSLTLSLGAETLLGPLLLSYSFLEHHNNAFFFSLGHRFALR